MLTNCLAACAHLSITVSEIQRDICEKIGILSYPLHSTPPLGGGGSRRNIGTPFVWETRMVSLPDGEKISKISLFILAQLTNVTDRRTDGQTPGDSNSRAMHSIARQKPAISRFYSAKRSEILSRLLSHMGCRLLPVLRTLNDLERHNALFAYHFFTARRVYTARTMLSQDVCLSVCPLHAGMCRNDQTHHQRPV